ncbi:MAG TPA: hypothetical protein VFI79_17950 [Gemmatimonadales bacterium]|nr:hypothetical protein [Gemmatimonadales bacterium]
MRPNYWTRVVAAVSVAALVACSPTGRAAETSGSKAKTPSPPAARTLEAGRQFSMATTQTISSRTAKPGDTFTATVVADVSDGAGRIAIPAGSEVSGTITDVKSASNPSSSGTLTLTVNSVTVRGRSYPIEVSIDSLDTQRQGQGVSGGDVAKVGAGVAAGAILGRVIGKNTKGAVIGGIMGGIVGAGIAVQTKHADIVLPAGTHVLVTLAQPLTVR